jgi:hypothetical protein
MVEDKKINQILSWHNNTGQGGEHVLNGLIIYWAELFD